MLVKKKYTYSYFEIKNIYEFFNKLVVMDGITNEATQFILKNLKTFESKYQEIMKGIYNPSTDPKIQEYNTEINTLMTKYADRNEQGDVIMEQVQGQDGQMHAVPKITEMIAEYNNDVSALQTKYKTTLDMAQNAVTYNTNYMNSKIEMEVDTWYGIHEFPDKLPPFVMLYFARDLI